MNKMQVPLKRPVPAGVQEVKITLVDHKKPPLQRERVAAISNSLKKHQGPPREHSEAQKRSGSMKEDIQNAHPIHRSPQLPTSSKLPPLRQRNPLGSPVSVSLHSTAVGHEDFLTSEPYGVSAVRPGNADLIGIVKTR